MDKVEKTLFSLLRQVSGSGTLSCPVHMTPARWEELFGISVRQMVGALVFEELQKSGNDMPAGLAARWKSYSDFARNRFDAQLLALNHLAQFLEGNGIPLMVLKGIGLSLLYPCPQNRECCDVDVFCFGQYDRSNELLFKAGLVSKVEEENDKHCSFIFDGINVENHKYFSEYVNGANVRVGEEILKLSSTAAMTDPRLPGLFFPGPEMGALHLLMHTLSHLAWSGISLRHLCDVTLFFKKYGRTMDWDYLHSVLREAGLEDSVSLLLCICERYLGLDIEGFNLGESSSSEMDFIVESILHPFLSSSETSNPVAKLHRKARLYRYRRRAHKLVYGVEFPDSFLMSFAFLRRFQAES